MGVWVFPQSSYICTITFRKLFGGSVCEWYSFLFLGLIQISCGNMQKREVKCLGSTCRLEPEFLGSHRAHNGNLICISFLFPPQSLCWSSLFCIILALFVFPLSLLSVLRWFLLIQWLWIPPMCWSASIWRFSHGRLILYTYGGMPKKNLQGNINKTNLLPNSISTSKLPHLNNTQTLSVAFFICYSSPNPWVTHVIFVLITQSNLWANHIDSFSKRALSTPFIHSFYQDCPYAGPNQQHLFPAMTLAS